MRPARRDPQALATGDTALPHRVAQLGLCGRQLPRAGDADGPHGYISKDPVILQAAEALASFNGKYHFPKGPNGGGGSGFGWEPTLIGLESSTGAILPSNFVAPFYNYETVFGDIICAYQFYQSDPSEMVPYIISIGKANGVFSGVYLHNIVAEPFMNPTDIMAVTYTYPGINVQDMYPDHYGVAIVTIVNADGTFSHVPIQTEFADEHTIKMTFPQDICDVVQFSVGSGKMEECLYGEPN